MRKDCHESQKSDYSRCGSGSAFLPATKTIPKELFPIVDKPILLYVVEEAVEAGMEDIILVTNENKRAVESFFDEDRKLEKTLIETGREQVCETIKKIRNMANVIHVRQKEARGLGHAVYCAKSIVGDQSFALLLGDEIMVSEKKNVTSQIKDLYMKTQSSSVAVMKVAPSEVSRYGIISVEDEQSRPMKVQSVIEKPETLEAPSHWALPGRYVFTASIFNFLENLSPGKNNEIQLTDGMTHLARTHELYATPFVAQRYDAGSKLGYLQANIEMGLRHPEVGKSLKRYLKKLSPLVEFYVDRPIVFEIFCFFDYWANVFQSLVLCSKGQNHCEKDGSQQWEKTI